MTTPCRTAVLLVPLIAVATGLGLAASPSVAVADPPGETAPASAGLPDEVYEVHHVPTVGDAVIRV